MITIIKHGVDFYKKKCQICGAEFTFDPIDIHRWYSGETLKKSVDCPCCGCSLDVDE